MKMFTMNEEQIFEEIVERGKMELISGREAFDSLVEETLEEFVDHEELDIDQDTEGMESHLKARWEEYKARLEE
jgi:hypothetical protein